MRAPSPYEHYVGLRLDDGRLLDSADDASVTLLEFDASGRVVRRVRVPMPEHRPDVLLDGRALVPTGMPTLSRR